MNYHNKGPSKSPVDHNGMVENNGDERATYFGMWKDSWTHDSYMWVVGRSVYMSHMKPTKVMSKCRFAVVEHLNHLGYVVLVPNPSIFVWPETPESLGFTVEVAKATLGKMVIWRKMP